MRVKSFVDPELFAITEIQGDEPGNVDQARFDGLIRITYTAVIRVNTDGECIGRPRFALFFADAVETEVARRPKLPFVCFTTRFFPFSVSSVMKLNLLIPVIRVEHHVTQPLRALAYDAGVGIDASILH